MEKVTAPDIHIIDYEQDDCLQLVLGVDHSRCLEQKEVYDYYYRQFLGHIASHDTKPLILYEGTSIPIPEDTEEDCLRSERGEVSLLFHWARQNAIPIKTFEIRDVDVLTGLYFKGYDPQFTSVYFMIRQHRQWHEMPSRPDFKEYMNVAMERYRKAAYEFEQLHVANRWPQDSFDIDKMIERFNYMYEPYDRRFDAEDTDFLLAQTKVQAAEEFPLDGGARAAYPYQDTAGVVSSIRERHKAHLIQQCAREGTSIFSFIGDWHARDLASKLGRKSHTVSVEDCRTTLSNNSPRRPKTYNTAKMTMYSNETFALTSSMLVPTIDVYQGDSRQLIVGTDRSRLSEQLEEYRYRYEQFLNHAARRSTEPLLICHGDYSGYPARSEQECLTSGNVENALLAHWARNDHLPFKRIDTTAAENGYRRHSSTTVRLALKYLEFRTQWQSEFSAETLNEYACKAMNDYVYSGSDSYYSGNFQAIIPDYTTEVMDVYASLCNRMPRRVCLQGPVAQAEYITKHYASAIIRASRGSATSIFAQQLRRYSYENKSAFSLVNGNYLRPLATALERELQSA